MPDYTTWGAVRGGCGHIHLTVADADACALADREACAGLGGGAYGDRRAYVVRDGRLYHITSGEPAMDGTHHARFRQGGATIPTEA